MKKLFALCLTIVSLQAISQTEMTVTVGGESMYPSKNIIENAVNSKDHTTLVAAVKAAGLVETFQGKGPLLIFELILFLLKVRQSLKSN